MVKLNEHTKEEYIQHILHLLKEQDQEKFRIDFMELHPTDRMEIFQSLDEDMKKLIYQYLTPAEFAEIFQELEVEEQKEVAVELNDAYTVEMFNNMYADDVADFLGEIQDTEAKEFLSSMTKEDAEDVKELLAYPPETAGAIMTKEFVSIKETDTAAEVLNHLRREGPDAETIYYLYVVDEKEHLVGVVSLRDLIISPVNQTIDQIMSSRVVSVEAATDQEEVARLIKKYDFLAAPVVTTAGKLIGIVTVDDVMDVLEKEATEDLGEIFAIKGAADMYASAFTSAKQRAPWIIMLMFFGMITASVIGRFEQTLEEIVLLAVFIPLLMGTAGNTGTQSLAVAVRSLATGTLEKKGLFATVKQEFGTGLILGIICAAVLAIMIPFFYGSYLLAFIVGLSLLITLSVSTVIGTVIPFVINKLSLDPAIASGPFITTLNDLLSLLIYFSIATSLLQYL